MGQSVEARSYRAPQYFPLDSTMARKSKTPDRKIQNDLGSSAPGQKKCVPEQNIASSDPVPQAVKEPISENFDRSEDSITSLDNKTTSSSRSSAVETIQLETLQSLVREFQGLKSAVLQHVIPHPNEKSRSDNALNESEATAEQLEVNTSASQQVKELLAEVDHWQHKAEDLEQQNQDLATKIANHSVQESIGSSQTASSNPANHDLLSWEDRKALIYRQMEDDTFDADSFVNTLQQSSSQAVGEQLDSEGGNLDPTALVNKLISELERHEKELSNREEELGELRCILEQRTEIQQLPEADPSQGVAIGAAAIAQMLDNDELICDERERLQEMQTEWEEKFRKVEIEASLERAKLSRERQELAKKNVELEEQLEHLRRENNLAKGTDSKKRRWMTELGITQD